MDLHISVHFSLLNPLLLTTMPLNAICNLPIIIVGSTIFTQELYSSIILDFGQSLNIVAVLRSVYHRWVVHFQTQLSLMLYCKSKDKALKNEIACARKAMTLGRKSIRS